MGKQVQKQKQASKQESIIEDLPQAKKTDLSATDDLIDEIDGILDTELVAAEYVQQGGQ